MSRKRDCFPVFISVGLLSLVKTLIEVRMYMHEPGAAESQARAGSFNQDGSKFIVNSATHHALYTLNIDSRKRNYE